MSMLRAVYFSIAVHLIIYLVINFFPTQWTKAEPKVVTEVEIINRPFKEDKKSQQIVRQAKVPEKIILHDEAQARFLSEQRQRVIMESRARSTGLTRNTDSNKPQQLNNRPELQPRDQAQRSYEKSRDGYEPIRLPRPNEVSMDTPSTVGETLPNEIALGSFTALNTDRYQFYSFYSRVEELVRFRWETQVRAAVDSYDRKYVAEHIGRRNWITQAEFLITPDGHLKNAMIMKESGIKVFDQAAVYAFRDARFFPNPPKELVEADGFIHLKYSFDVYFEPSALASQ